MTRFASNRFRAWSCAMRLVVGDPACLTEATAQLRALLARVDGAASRFRDDSELSRANAHPGRPTPVSRLLIELIDEALVAARQTAGAVDPTVGRGMAELGYDRDIGAVARHGPPVRPRPSRARWSDIVVDRGTGLLTVPVGTALDLGATAKASTADRAARALHGRFDTPVLVELGGDLAVAGGGDGGWPVRVAESAAGPGELVRLTAGGMATSTTTIRRWRRGDVELHHILDPRTGASARGPWRTVTVAAVSALAANTATTAALVLGEGALSWLSARGLNARLVSCDGAVATTAGWPTERRRVA